MRVFNAGAQALFGVSGERAAGRAIIAVIPSVEVERMIEAALRGETRTRDVAFGSGARERFFGITVQPYEDGAMAIATDRTAYLANERVRREFTANVSHELRTPLTGMKLMLETLQVADDDAEARALFLPRIGAEVERMIRLVEDLLELARSETGTVPLRREHFDLVDVVRSTVNAFAQRATALGVELQLDAPRPVAVAADRGRLTQVVVNLLDNALRHTPPGGRVTVELVHDDDAAVLRVRDTGIGHPVRRPAAHLRALLRGRPLALARARRHGPRAGHRQAPGGGSRRVARGRFGLRPGRDVRHAGARRERSE